MTTSVLAPAPKRRLSCVEEEVDEMQRRRRSEVYKRMRRWISWAGEDDMMSFSQLAFFYRRLLFSYFLFV